MTFDLRRVHLSIVRDLCERFHGYRSAGGVAAYAFAVFEDGLPVAAYAWQPPPPGAAKSVCPEAPHGVLALSRMVAVPKAERFLRHVSKPLRAQMKHEIDRTRWPVLVTYSDEGQGHTGYVYQCSGWEKTSRRRVEIRTDRAGARASRYSNGKTPAHARGAHVHPALGALGLRAWRGCGMDQATRMGAGAVHEGSAQRKSCSDVGAVRRR